MNRIGPFEWIVAGLTLVGAFVLIGQTCDSMAEREAAYAPIRAEREAARARRVERNRRAAVERKEAECERLFAESNRLWDIHWKAQQHATRQRYREVRREYRDKCDR